MPDKRHDGESGDLLDAERYETSGTPVAMGLAAISGCIASMLAHGSFLEVVIIIGAGALCGYAGWWFRGEEN
ncbi:hypothetical protein [Ciceribacter sp. L1K22]|uniref:hypothetical protein n=1 Tax=Ciceribacter sp. L1K22 TaxID=2820275 RepID=UPI001ABE0378|nr:hypothetical protein [Ciceribacter sp. L1K22]MBO3761510.1 hypothetical protein [Ciceribacter sp. L1K22]